MSINNHNMKLFTKMIKSIVFLKKKCQKVWQIKVKREKIKL